MTSMPVMDKGGLMSVSYQTKTAKPSTDSGLGGFSQVMQRSQKTEASVTTTKSSEKESFSQDKNTADYASEDVNAKEVQETKTETPEAEQNVKENTSETKDKVTEEATKTEKTVQENDEVGTEALEEASELLMSQIAQVMDVPLETVQETMEQLDISKAELLTEDGVKSLMIGLDQDADEMSLLTDENLYAKVNEALTSLEKVTSNVKEEYQLDDKQFSQILEKMDGESQNVTGQLLQENEQVAMQPVMKNSEEENTTETKQKVVLDQPVTDTAHDSITSDLLTKAEVKSEDTSDKSEHQNPFMQNMNMTNIAANEQLQQAQELESTFEMPSTSEIMDQILDYMKVSVKPEMSQLEMQLHPESLGSLHIQISSREGVMTAQFTTQSEEVKAVVESQLLQLRENLEEQGVKVEAVEVTVAQYSLERNMGENAGEQQKQELEKQKKGRKIIDLNDLTLDMDDLSVEEKLTAEIMQSEGSTVNYKA